MYPADPRCWIRCDGDDDDDSGDNYAPGLESLAEVLWGHRGQPFMRSSRVHLTWDCGSRLRRSERRDDAHGQGEKGGQER